MELLTANRLRCAVWLGFFATCLCRAQALHEYQVKAAFLYSFAKFVEWPPQAFQTPSAPVTICVLGEDPFGSFLDDAVRGKTIGHRPVNVQRLFDLPAGRDCKVLFIAGSERRRIPVLLASITTPGVLTVGDTAEFTALGGVIGLLVDGDRIRLSVNLAAAEKAKVQISSRVLSLATIIR